ncbi:nitroreductase family protein [Nocardioides sp.]|uniref:nitroreductase family protein n=1 Tax=Nocardioides sp. TaxID=35761 RepID=UPI002733564C|nr:nitroreductase family protein [Nocardioides sp.]MDP3890470.1 nitroreductase family protein [Nocardioides sp.]
MAHTHELLASRWSPSIFDPRHELARADLELLLTAARWAPSSGNTQPWSFLVGLRGDPTHRMVVESLSRGNSGWAPPASALLVALAQVAEDPDAPGGKGGIGTYAEYALGQAVAHLTVQARAMGLHTHQFAGFDHDRIANEAQVPAHVKVVVGIAVGRHGDPATAEDSLVEREARPRSRKPLEAFVFAGRWGRPW